MGVERTDAWLEICIRDALKDDPDTPVPTLGLKRLRVVTVLRSFKDLSATVGGS